MQTLNSIIQSLPDSVRVILESIWFTLITMLMMSLPVAVLYFTQSPVTR